MSEREREVHIPGLGDADRIDRDQTLSGRDSRADSSSYDDERRAAAADSGTGEPRININDLDASANAWGSQDYGEVM